MLKNVVGVAVFAVAALTPVVSLAQEDEASLPYVYGIYYQCDMTRQELADASVERMRQLAEEGTQAMEASAEGSARAYLRSSLWADTALDRSILTTSRLVQSGDQGAREAMLSLEARWYRMLEAELGDPVAAQAVLHMGDGLYQNAALGILADRAQDREAVMEQLLEALERLRPSG